jgi:tRNA A37 threonylcarbamoyladenosine biosynthesis protein TsaE
MLRDELTYRILQEFRFEPTDGQREVIDVFTRFLTDDALNSPPSSLMLLRGSAGTGKTSLAGAIVRTLKALEQKVVLLAPTGRAAKVYSMNSGNPAYTIHRKIYRQKALMGDFSLNMNAHQDTLFMVDEASMIANAGSTDTPFGTGRLLDDLVEFVYTGRNCRLMLIGDKAQLPPVGEKESPALSGSYLAGYGMKVYECDLDEVLRQSQESGILWNATKIREIVGETDLVPSSPRFPVLSLPRIRLQGFPDVRVVPGDELIETLSSSYSKVGIDETMVVTRSNKRANIYNQGIRNMILGREDELTRGDLLMVVKNNYSLTPPPDTPNSAPSTFSFIANGDMAVVQRVRHIEELYGFRFAEVTVQFPDYDNVELTAKVLLDTLTVEAPALTREQHNQLFERVLEDYAEITRKRDRMEKLKTDPYYNALQVKYGYAVTCHKAQGGQWAHIYIDQGYMTDDMLTPDYIHWLYTAFTRATEQIYLVNWPKQQIL